MALPDLAPRFATPRKIRQEVANALSRLQADRPKLADACEPASIARLVSLVLEAIDRECRWHFGLWTASERAKHLRVWSVLRRDGVDIGMSASTGMGGYQQEPGGAEGSDAPSFVALKTKRKEELLTIPAVMLLVERVVLHAYAVLADRGREASELVLNGRRVPGVGYARIMFFTEGEITFD